MLGKLHIGQNTIFRGDINQVAGKLLVGGWGFLTKVCYSAPKASYFGEEEH